MTTIIEHPSEVQAGYDSRRRLVVIGNGMAGARVVEEIIARGGSSMFSITMFGDEPYGIKGVRLRDETELDCDLVVVAAGIRPNTDVATTSGFTVERAIVVDDQMRTVDDDHVFAVGECVQHRGEVFGLVAPLWEQAVVLADVITGNNPQAAYLGSRTATKLKVAGVEVAAMGLTEPEHATDEHIIFSEPKRGVFKSVVIRDDRIIGATLLGDSKKLAFLQHAFRSWPAAARGAGRAVIRSWRPRRQTSAWPSSPTTHRSATAMA